MAYGEEPGRRLSTSAHGNRRKTDVGLAWVDLVGESENVRIVLVYLPVGVAAETALRQKEHE